MSRPGSRPADEDQLLAVGRSLTKSRGLHFELPIRRTLDTPNDDEGDTTPGRHDVQKATDHGTMDNSEDEGDTTPGQYDVQKAIDHDNTDNSDGESSPLVLTPDSGLSEDEDQGLVSTERSAIQSYQTNTSTPLDDSYKAISRGDIATVRKHLAANMIPCCKNSNGYTPLIIALLESQLEMAKFLLQNGASVHQRVNNIPPIIWAVMKPHLRTQFMRILLDHGALLSTTSGTYPYNALHWAVKEGIMEAVELLLEEGMDTEAVDSQGHTTLWLAAEFGHIDVLELLLAKGAKLDHRGLCSETVLSWAVCHDQADAVKCLFEVGISLDDCDDLGISPLSLASGLGLVEVVELLIELGADLNIMSAEPIGFTPIMTAAYNGRAGVVQILIDHGADLKILNRTGHYVLDVAMNKGDADTVGVLLEALGGEDYPQDSRALKIAMADSYDMVRQYMIEYGIYEIDLYYDRPTTDHEYEEAVAAFFKTGGALTKPRAMCNLMYVALEVKDLHMVGALMAQGFNPDEYLEGGQTPLHKAIVQGDLDMVKLLLFWGADPGLPTGNPSGRNNTPLQQALIELDDDVEKDTSIIDELLQSGTLHHNRRKLMVGQNAESSAFEYVLSHYSRWNEVAENITYNMLRYAQEVLNDRADDGSTLLHVAVFHRRHNLVETLLAKGFDIDVKDNQGCTPFILECQRSTRFLKFLLSKGADAHVGDNDGQNGLHAAAGAGKNRVIQFLLDLDSPLSILAVDAQGYSAFTWSLICGQEEAALYLLFRGAQISSRKFRRGRMELHIACSQGMSSELIRKLLENEYLKKRVNDRDDMGWTSLALACRKASSDTVLMLLDAGADTEKHPNNSLDRPLHIALRARNMEVVMALISHGADVTATGDRGQSTLHIVRNVGLTQILIQHGANVDALDDWGHTPLHMCYDAKTLIEHGADVNLADVNGWTAAHHAVHVGNLVLFSLLARSGANLNLRRKDSGQTVWEQIKEEVDESLHWTFTRAVETWIV